jgi:serine phosphatase RsbU (regulator of sigma subunit)/CBS domain-containing protein
MHSTELTVRQVMQPEPIAVEAGCLVQQALDLMNRHRIGAVVVTDRTGALAGIFTERDLLRRVACADPRWRDTPIADWMTRDPYTVGPDVGWLEAAGMLERLRVRHLPVLEGGRVIGLISTRLLMARRAEFLNRTIERRTRELRQANEQLMARDAEMMYNLRAAGRLQTRLLLPSAPPSWPELRWGIHYAPLDHLGGDLYDFVHPGPDHLGFLIADASGHSIPATMVAIMCRIAFAQVARGTTQPGEVLTAMNARLQGLTDERFVTAFYGVLDRRTRVLTYANAGHPYPFRWSARTGEVKPLVAQGFLLGIMPEEVYRERTVELEPGDRLCFYTDGLVEARDEIGQTFGTDRLRGCLTQYGGKTADELKCHIQGCQETFRGTHPLNDDVTLVVAELRAEASAAMLP